ncbi:MAG: hypothetical protein DRI90_10080 [Deltaproteobacteria bacterium]|nr:MAG: hypothetical protein DRI90_10080 [Deltaproteobacteria bacterium]
MTVPLWGGAFGGCASAPEATVATPDRQQAERSPCGWEEVDQTAPRLTIGADGEASQVASGGYTVVLTAAGEVPFGAIRQALEPLASGLVRVKVIIDGRWLLPMTYPYRPPVSLPQPDRLAVQTVGTRRITRSVGAPADRFADLRLAGDRVLLHVEHGGPSETLPVAKLAQRLRETEPAVGTVALRVSDETAFEHVVTVLVAAACYDRKPGEEPHEVILD